MRAWPGSAGPSSSSRGRSLYLRFLAEAAAVRGLHAEAKACCERVLELVPDDAAAHNAPGLVPALRRPARRGPASTTCAAIRLQPDLAAAHFNLGLLHEEMGDLADAEARFRTARPRRPGPRDGPGPPRLPASRGACPTEDLAALDRLLRQPDLPPGDRVNLLFALGEVLDARGPVSGRPPTRSQQANALALRQLAIQGRAYDPAEHRFFVDHS